MPTMSLGISGDAQVARSSCVYISTQGDELADLCSHVRSLVVPTLFYALRSTQQYTS